MGLMLLLRMGYVVATPWILLSELAVRRRDGSKSVAAGRNWDEQWRRIQSESVDSC
jgi:hypothetical protein